MTFCGNLIPSAGPMIAFARTRLENPQRRSIQHVSTAFPGCQLIWDQSFGAQHGIVHRDAEPSRSLSLLLMALHIRVTQVHRDRALPTPLHHPGLRVHSTRPSGRVSVMVGPSTDFTDSIAAHALTAVRACEVPTSTYAVSISSAPVMPGSAQSSTQ